MRVPSVGCSCMCVYVSIKSVGRRRGGGGGGVDGEGRGKGDGKLSFSSGRLPRLRPSRSSPHTLGRNFSEGDCPKSGSGVW